MHDAGLWSKRGAAAKKSTRPKSAKPISGSLYLPGGGKEKGAA
jgi:hypothetical protein